MALGRWRWKTPDLRGLDPGERFLSLLWMDPEEQYTRLASNLVVVVDTFNPSTWREADLWVQACLIYRTSFRIARPTQRKPVSDKTKQKDWPVASICTWVHTHSQCIDWRWGGKFKSSVVDMVDMGMMCSERPSAGQWREHLCCLSFLPASWFLDLPGSYNNGGFWPFGSPRPLVTVWPKQFSTLFPLEDLPSALSHALDTYSFVPSPLGPFCLLLVPFSLWCLPTHIHIST